ncbi:MAG: ATPase [Candidatus Staskawiczbacteria bacterium RIFOXYB2_FULL_32_9]|uniref:ATPase n=1 Tax=Candidatus Staskawiczbacteria bacterium RIFOXYD1_FULL_32_13 TaxID=1802234 RepID=A0A1G2JLJ5_9BACT|nr:MAG: hypothetical protein UR22_C0006G0023 [Parcubacteria group bacterium GW2011_GWC2_32_10]OGZ78471.1 MAG: ATPase [Candidatus Staskawiczbacteria bacterium RIFOXYB1_FULL_32_11]OGZ83767.1 MAG: ATPase [Candidatus Staskawiczbacteria bacterium RIFOXYB2_FULL_32_9]OGZ85854.1 MAG: ATPase [Candidatus Staskawiczbacteria bacterium RIFOXYC2_FULL_32_10]OGZ88005.1 MAG: ATPase [Candidatus Staskawiczbacteria bacterium RIFOXYD1_FULL_32_13]
MQIKRVIHDAVKKSLFKGKVVIIYGARQVGKTTLVKEILKDYPKNSEYFNCDEIDIRQAITDKTSTELKVFFAGKKLVILDEAQRVKNIGLTLKIIVDNFPDIQIIATGSSSFDLSNEISEPLTGRKFEFYLQPFSLQELKSIYSELEFKRLLERRIIYGMYPDVVLKEEDAEINLKTLVLSYTYKDILQYQNIKSPEVLEKLLQALALQVGNEVSYNELAVLVGIDKNTVSNYIQILEKAFIIFRLSPFSRNLRNELKKLRKIYFYDLGLRNAIINNFNPLSLRQDVGALWENFMISERVKRNNNLGIFANIFFWRVTSGKEIDYIEDSGGVLSGYEFKWQKDSFSVPKEFLSAYPKSSIKLINNKNYLDFLL